MSKVDAQSLFAQAERAFLAGDFNGARDLLTRVRTVAGGHPAVLHLLALVEKKRGDPGAARTAFESAIRAAPGDPQVLANYANLLAEADERDKALAAYGAALQASPAFADARLNRALLLQKCGRLSEALADLDLVIAARPADARALSARGSVLRALGRFGEAAKAYDAALRIDPARALALHGRARVAMERGEDGASEYYRRALAVAPGALELRLGYAEALEAEGRPGAVEALAATVAEHPDWIEGQAVLARMRWEAGEGEGFARAMQRRLAGTPANHGLWAALASALGAADLHREAAEAAAAGRRAAADDGTLMLTEAYCTSEAGETDRATALFAAVPRAMPGRAALEARHWLRCGDYARARDLLELARAEAPEDIEAWAVTSLVWRLAGDPRAAWLSEQPGLIASMSLDLDARQIDAIAARLRSLHRTRVHPIGQSLRGGTQTRGRLFAREEAEIELLRDSIGRAIQEYWEGLPKHDPGHPLLRHRIAQPQLAGSWSVRLTGGGFHVPHFHPEGILSSACYFVVPEARVAMEGWLEIGGSPSGLDTPLEPLQRIEPAPGRLALFPSYLYHGTRPFSAGERLTAAFDVGAG